MHIETPQAFGLKKFIFGNVSLEIARLHGFFFCWGQAQVVPVSQRLRQRQFQFWILTMFLSCARTMDDLGGFFVCIIRAYSVLFMLNCDDIRIIWGFLKSWGSPVVTMVVFKLLKWSSMTTGGFFRYPHGRHLRKPPYISNYLHIFVDDLGNQQILLCDLNALFGQFLSTTSFPGVIPCDRHA